MGGSSFRPVWNWRMTGWCFISSGISARWRLGGGLVGLVLLGLAAVGPAVGAGTPLPRGLDAARWGMTVDELRRQVPIEKVDLNDPFSHAEHLEQEPEIYARETADGKRAEYYFYNGELYKIFVIHARNQRDPALYHQLVQQLTAIYGPPQRTYEEVVFGLKITHTVWEEPTTRVDLRFGGGFVFQVHTDRIRSDAKETASKRKKSI